MPSRGNRWKAKAQRAVAVNALLVLGAGAGMAQQGGRVVGVITSQATGQPVAGALILVHSTHHTSRADSLGRFRLDSLGTGQRSLEARAIGYEPESLSVMLSEGIAVRLSVALRPVVQRLPGVSVDEDALAARDGRMQGFWRRRSAGFGKFLTRSDIERRDARESRDLLRGIPGLRLVGDRVTMTTGTSRSCVVQYYVDGLHVVSPSLEVLAQFRPRDLEGLEVYRGPAETPLEFSRGGAECGVIAIWTRVGRRSDH